MLGLKDDTHNLLCYYSRYRIAGYCRGVLIFIIFVLNPSVINFPPTKFSIHTSALSTRANVQTGWHFYSSYSLHACVLLMIHRISFLKLSCVWWSKWTEKWTRQKRNQKMWSVPLIRVCKHRRSSCFVGSQISHRVYRVQSSHYVICKQKYNIAPENLILAASSSFSRKFPPIKMTCYTVPIYTIF